jgi:hypothetical protein
MPPKKTYRPKKSTTDSFRIKIGGSGNIWPTAELRAMLMEAVDRIEAAGITHVKPCHLYIPPVDAKGAPIVRIRGHELEDIVIPAPYRSAADEHGL